MIPIHVFVSGRTPEIMSFPSDISVERVATSIRRSGVVGGNLEFNGVRCQGQQLLLEFGNGGSFQFVGGCTNDKKEANLSPNSGWWGYVTSAASATPVISKWVQVDVKND